jgi:hypothetical protein
VFNFKSTMAQLTKTQFESLRLPPGYRQPQTTDYYRFVLTRPEIDGILCSPQSPQEVRELARALEQGGMSAQEEEYMIWLSGLTQAPVLT